MTFEHLIMVLIAVITGVAGWVGNIITNAPKQEESTMNRINLIIVEYEKSLERCNERNKVLVKENRELREKMKGGE